MREDKAAAGFQPPSSSHQHPLTLSRHVTPLSHGRFPSLRSKPDFVYGSVLWRLLSLSPSPLHSLTLIRGVNPRTSYASVCQYASPHFTVCVRTEVRRVTRLFPPFPFRIISFFFFLHRSIRRASGFRFHLSRSQT